MYFGLLIGVSSGSCLDCDWGRELPSEEKE